MPFPLNKVRTLDDFNGEFTLDITCKTCGHARLIPARVLANYVGKRARVRHAVARLRCSKCQGREHDIWVVGIPR